MPATPQTFCSYSQVIPQFNLPLRKLGTKKFSSVPSSHRMPWPHVHTISFGEEKEVFPLSLNLLQWLLPGSNQFRTGHSDPVCVLPLKRSSPIQNSKNKIQNPDTALRIKEILLKHSRPDITLSDSYSISLGCLCGQPHCRDSYYKASHEFTIL